MAAKDKGKRVLQSGVKIAGLADTGKAKKAMPETITLDTITFEGLSRNVCRTWWLETPYNYAIKESLKNAWVQWAIQMQIFAIRDFESCLRMMVATYDSATKASTFSY